jgi:hypothetical protein
MSRKGDIYREIPVTIWDREDFRDLSANAQAVVLYLYMLTGPLAMRIPGLFRAGRAALAEGLRWPLERFADAFQEIETRRMAVADWNAPLVWMPGELNDFNQPKNHKHAIGWVNAFRLLPECPLKEKARAAVIAYLESYGYRVDTHSIRYREGSDTQPNSVAVAVDSRQKQEGVPADAGPLSDPDQPLDGDGGQKKRTPRTPPAGHPAVAAYCDKWTGRYGKSPFITGKDAGLLATLHRKFPEEFGHRLARYFEIDDRLVIEQCHPVGLLVTSFNRLGVSANGNGTAPKMDPELRRALFGEDR